MTTDRLNIPYGQYLEWTDEHKSGSRDINSA
jgi:hypothetical protein